MDRAIASRVAWNTDSPLFLQPVPTHNNQFYRSARVGLSLKKAQITGKMPQYILLSYRYLTETRRITKGKPYLVLYLYLQGLDAIAINQLTGCPKQSIQRYI